LATAAKKIEVIVFQGVQNLPIFAARANGYFARRGIELNLQFTPNSWALRDGLAAGTYDIAHTAVDNAIAMAELAGRDIAVVMGGDSGYNALFLQPEITGIADLKGRTVLVDAPDTAFALVLYKILAVHGLRRGDYEAKSVGATPLRLAAMKEDKSAAATIMNLPFRVLGERAGLRNMGDAVGYIGPYLATAGFVMRAWAARNADVLTRYIQAYVEGLRWAIDRANAEAAMELLKDNLQIEETVARDAYKIATAPGGFATDARVDRAGLQNVLRLRAEVEGQWGGVAPAPERYLDLSFYQRALAATS
jgi:ABC-type nitrate/sulfonate/bicarbonate transport system substrate-binding protein